MIILICSQIMISRGKSISRFGLVQHKGGPCGVLAVVQAQLIKVPLLHSLPNFDLPLLEV